MKYNFIPEEKKRLDEITQKLKSYADFNGIDGSSKKWKSKDIHQILSMNYPQLNQTEMRYIVRYIMRFFYHKMIKNDPELLERQKQNIKRYKERHKEKLKADPIKYAAEKRKRLEYNKKYLKRHPEKAKEHNRKTYERLKNDPERLARFREYHKKYSQRPEVRERQRKLVKKYFQKMRKENPEKYRKMFGHRGIGKTIGGLLCKNCGFKIITNTAKRLGKRFVKCPKCGNESRGRDMEKVRIEREIPKNPVFVPYRKEEKITFYEDISNDVIRNFKRWCRLHSRPRKMPFAGIIGHRRCKHCGSKEFTINIDSEGKRIRKVIHKNGCSYEKRMVGI